MIINYDVWLTISLTDACMTIMNELVHMLRVGRRRLDLLFREVEAEVEGLPIRNPRNPGEGMRGPELRKATSLSSPVSNAVTERVFSAFLKKIRNL